jgi:hypothetical protein
MISKEKQWGLQKMGTLKPGATYIYERVDGTVYAREAGSDPSTRTTIGYNWQPGNESYYKNIADNYFFEIHWAPIFKEAENNPALQEALDRVKILYHLSKKDG